MIVLLIICLIMLIDLIGTFSAISVVRSRIKRIILIDDISESLQKAADTMGEGLTGWVLKHLEKSYSGLEPQRAFESPQAGKAAPGRGSRKTGNICSGLLLL